MASWGSLRPMNMSETDAVVAVAGWPIVVLVCPARFDVPWVESLGREFDAVFARGERFAVVTETSLVGAMPGALERKALANWASRADQLALQKRFNVGSSTVVRNALTRGVMQAIYWMWTPPSPQHAAKDFDDAFSWSLTMATQAGLCETASGPALKRAALDEVRRRGVEVPSSSPLP